MRDPFRTIADLSKAEKWLTKELLNRHDVGTHRLLRSTKLSALVYRGLMTDNEKPENAPDDRFPINTDALAEDLYTALYAPVIRRYDATAVALRERLFNCSLLETVLQDDRFDRLKQLCEDKELPAFEAAHAFRNTLIDRLPKSANVLVPLKLLSVYDRMREKENQVTQALQSGKDGLSEKRRLFFYNRVYRLKKQQRDLEQKLRESAISYVDELGFAVGDAIEAALTQATEVNTVMTAWGTENGTMQNDKPNRELLAHVRSSKELLAVAKTLGRYKDIIADKRKNGFTYGLGEKYDLTFGNDITNCLSGELAMLGIAETEILFMRKYEQRRLMQYRKRTASIKGRGDMIVLLDESSSTKSVASWAKAFALALLDIAAKDKRKYALIHFSSAEQVKTDLFEPGHYTAEDVMQAAEQFFGGGTDFEAPLKEALGLMQSGYEKADITIITDGKCQLSDTFCRRFLNELRTYRATVTSILLDKDGSCGETLESFCDKIYHSKELTEEEIAIEILNEKAS